MSLSCKLGLSANGKTINEDLFAAYAKAGIEAMELTVVPDWDEVARLSAQYGVRLWSFHLPFWPFNELDLSHPDLAAQTVAAHKDMMRQAHAVGIRTFVVHASGEPVKEDRAVRMACAKQSLKELAQFAATLDSTVAVEDLPRSCLGNCSADILELISVHDNLRVCLDTNHLLGEDIVHFIETVGDKIITTHVSDYDYINERHWLPGEGKQDWNAITNALEKVGYSGYWLYEIRFEAPWSITRDRDLTTADFRDNYNALMAGKTPAPIGTPKEHLGMWEVEA